jgi:D-alanyl-D-alanine carboxypeptidase
MTPRRLRHLCALALWAGVLVAPLGAQAADAQGLQRFLNRFVQTQELPGAVLAVTDAEGSVVVASGQANLATGTPVQPDTRFYIASSGKLMTGAAVLQQVESGRYRLQDRVLRLLEPFEGLRRIANVDRVTVEQLLKHRSGLAEYYDDAFERAARKQPNKRWTAAESLAFIADEDASDEPGAAFEYVNSNFVLLGHLVASQDGQSYEQSIRRRLIDPLRLTHTTVGADPSEDRLAHGYTLNRRGRPSDVSRGGWTAITGDGAIVTTAGDYDRFVRALLRDGQVLSKAAVQRMCTRQREEPDADYGMACMVIRTPGGDAWGHNGAIDGFNAETWYLPRRDVSVVLLANGEYDADSADILRQVLKVLDR